MGNNYRLDVYNTSGSLQYVITDFNYLMYTRRVNNPGVIQFGIPGDHAMMSTVGDKWQVEVWRKPEDADWGREITGLIRKVTWQYTDQSYAELFCNGLMSILGWRVVAWYANTDDRSAFTSEKAETIANLLVKYNGTTDATAVNGRLRDGAISGLTVEADGAAGNTIDFYCAYANLLTALKDIATVGGGDFDLVKTSSTAWQYRWYDGQLGTNRASTVTFAMNRGNMANPIYKDDHINEATVAIVGGQGEGDSRATAIRTSTDYHITTNNIETFVHATDINVDGGLDTRGDEKLKTLRSTQSFEFDVLQIPSTQYGVDYSLGDLVTVVNPYNETEYTMKIEAVHVSINQNGDETIKVEMLTQ